MESRGISGRRKKSGRGNRIHLTAGESHGSRVKKRLLGNTSWYRRRKREETDGVRNQGGGRKGSKEDWKEDCLKTRAVKFVEQTPRGELARRVKEQLQGLEGTLGFKLKVVERTGRSLKSVFSQGQTNQGLQCGRVTCVTCNQEGEERPPCTLSSIVYESICKPCNPNCIKKGELKRYEGDTPSLYVGETSRSIQERALEHWGAARRGGHKSHMVNHQSLEHPGEPPDFQFKMVSSHRSALSRQVREAVRIRRRGGMGSILNSKGEFSRCYIPRLVVE